MAHADLLRIAVSVLLCFALFPLTTNSFVDCVALAQGTLAATTLQPSGGALRYTTFPVSGFRPELETETCNSGEDLRTIADVTAPNVG